MQATRVSLNSNFSTREQMEQAIQNISGAQEVDVAPTLGQEIDAPEDVIDIHAEISLEEFLNGSY